MRESGAESANLAHLMGEADQVSLHVPLSAETRGLMAEAEIALMKPTVYLVNTARGGVLDDRAVPS